MTRGKMKRGRSDTIKDDEEEQAEEENGARG